MLRIVHYLPRIRLVDGGVVRAVLDLCAVMARRGNAVTLVVCDPHDVPTEWMDGGPGLPAVRVLRSPGRLGLLSRATCDLVRSLVAMADIVHLHELWLVSNLQWAKICREIRKPYVVTLHGMLDDWAFRHRHAKKRLYLWAFARRLLATAARVHSTARGELRQASRWFSNERTSVLPLLLDLQPFRQLPGPGSARSRYPSLNAGAPTVLFLGRLHVVKRVDLLFEAIAALRRRGVECRGIVAGTGDADYEAHLRRRVDELELSQHIIFVGAVSGEDKLSLYEAADVFALASMQENFGMVLVEALACGTPVVTTRAVDIWEEIQDAGAMIVEATPDAFANAIETLTRKPEQNAAIGAQGRDWVFQTMEPQLLGERYEQMYELARTHALTAQSNAMAPSTPAS